ncbi:hypothetical protein GW17_00019285 [Ensete ventricosum]|nr:hypothetical protein GW17_00019285 [Ensete ventricosum]
MVLVASTDAKGERGRTSAAIIEAEREGGPTGSSFLAFALDFGRLGWISPSYAGAPGLDSEEVRPRYSLLFLQESRVTSDADLSGCVAW